LEDIRKVGRDEFKLEIKKKYSLIYLNEHARCKYVWNLFGTGWVIENESGRDDQDKEERDYGTCEKMNGSSI
jgi:hypothetical protein